MTDATGRCSLGLAALRAKMFIEFERLPRTAAALQPCPGLISSTPMGFVRMPRDAREEVGPEARRYRSPAHP